MTKRRQYVTCLLICFFLATLFYSIMPAQAWETKADLSKIRQARDLIHAREYEAAYKILKPLERNRRALHRLADLMMRKDDANPYYDLDTGCQYLRMAAEYGSAAAYAKWAFAEMLKLSPYLRQMPELMARETFKWYLAAAELGYAPAQQTVGEMLADGRPKTDYLEAYMWLTLAHNRYVQPPAKSKKDEKRAQAVTLTCNAMVEKGHITVRQVKKALKMARKWEKQHPDAYKVWPVDDEDY
jgi:hypothetical protein